VDSELGLQGRSELPPALRGICTPTIPLGDGVGGGVTSGGAAGGGGDAGREAERREGKAARIGDGGQGRAAGAHLVTPANRRPPTNRKILWNSAVAPASAAATPVLKPQSRNAVAPVMVGGKVESMTDVKRPHPPLFDRPQRISQTPTPKRNLLMAL
jgi:hypothetical protein